MCNDTYCKTDILKHRLSNITNTLPFEHIHTRAHSDAQESKHSKEINTAKGMVESDMEKMSCLLTISGSKSNMSGHQAALSNVKFLDKGHTIMSTSVDGEVRFWDLSLLLRLKLTQIGLERHKSSDEKSKDESFTAGGLGYATMLRKFFRKRLNDLYLKIGKAVTESESNKDKRKSSRRDKVTRTDHRSILMAERSAILAFIWIVLESRTPWEEEEDGDDKKKKEKVLVKCENHKVHNEYEKKEREGSRQT